MDDNLFSFENLQVWKESKTFVATIYKVIAKFPTEERFALCTQVRRAVTSIPLNLAEGSARLSYREKIRFVEYAFGSLNEVYCQLCIAVELDYITQGEVESLKPTIHHLGRMLKGLRRSFEGKD